VEKHKAVHLQAGHPVVIPHPVVVEEVVHLVVVVVVEVVHLVVVVVGVVVLQVHPVVLVVVAAVVLDAMHHFLHATKNWIIVSMIL
jgi:hypothetical protein